jgi:hypothetical protein
MANANFKSMLLDETIAKLSIDELVRFWTIIQKKTSESCIWDKNKWEDMKMLMESFDKGEQSAQWSSIMSFPNRYFVCDKMESERVYMPLTIDIIANDLVRKHWDDIFHIIAQNPHKLDEIKYFDNVYYPCMLESVYVEDKPKYDQTKEKKKFLSKAAIFVMDVNDYIENKLHWHNAPGKWYIYNDDVHVGVGQTDLDLEQMFALIWQFHFNFGNATFETPNTTEWKVYYEHNILGTASLGFSIGYKNGEIFVEYPSKNHQLFPDC